MLSAISNPGLDLSSLSLGTKDVEEVPCKIGDKFVILVDTPDTNRTDTEVLTLLFDWMKDSYKERQLSGIIYISSLHQRSPNDRFQPKKSPHVQKTMRR